MQQSHLNIKYSQAINGLQEIHGDFVTECMT